jgi:hypothetical protein
MAVIALFLVFQIAAFFTGAAYLPSEPSYVNGMMRLSLPAKGKVLVDLGSGDGVLLAAAARAGATAIGYEINPVLVALCRLRIMLQGLEGRVSVRMSSYWGADLSEADIITVYGMPHMMGRLEKKLSTGLKPGCVVVAVGCEFPTWPPVRTLGLAFLYLPGLPPGRAASAARPEPGRHV